MNKQSMKRRLFVDCRIEGTSDDVNDDVEWEDSVREAFQVLQEYTLLGDPMQTLQHYYQKKGHIESISTSWQPPRYYRVGKGKDSSTYWRCTFTCPLDPSMKGSSVIATALLRNQEPSTVVEGTILQLEELSKQWFGDFLISPHDNHVYFGTKKNAKRSAAFGFLWDVFGTSGVKEQLLAPSSKSIITTTKVFAPTRSIRSWEKKISKLSKIPWINDLYDRCGIRSISIEYMEHSMMENPQILSPSYIICRMEIHQPIHGKVMSDPQPSKTIARNQAVERLIMKVEQERPIPRATILPSPSPDVDCNQSWIEKEELLLCDSPYLHLNAKVPGWARWRPSHQEKAILYQLVLEGYDDRLGLADDELTPVGIILPFDSIFRYDEEILSFQTKLSAKSDGTESQIQLVNPQEMVLDKTDLLDNFATICNNWKLYGTNCSLESLKTRVTASHRNYHFVPLVRGKKKNELVVNWDLMADVVNNKIEPYLTATRRIRILHLCLICFTFYIAGNLFRLDLYITILVTLIALASSFWWFPNYNYRTNVKAFTNHFLLDDSKKNFPFIPSSYPVTRFTSLSYVLSPEARTEALTEGGQADVNLRFTDLFRNRFKKAMKHPTVHLVSAHPAGRLVDFNPFRDDKLDLTLAPRRKLFPELVYILPIPRDFLFMVGFAETYMIPLETTISHSSNAHSLMEASTTCGRTALGVLNDTQSITNEKRVQRHLHLSTFNELLSQATTIFPTARYERLEFIGDRVLNHLVSLCLVARNGALEWEGDDFRNHYAYAKGNSSLGDGAVRAGLARLVHAGTIRWKDDSASFAIPDSHITNMGESIFGAVFMYGTLCADDHERAEMMLAGFVERLNLPLPADQDDHTNDGWFRGDSLGLAKGVCLSQHQLWESRFREVEEALLSTTRVRQIVREKSERLISILIPDKYDSMVLSRSRLCDGRPRLLLDIAVFDANLDGSDPLIQDSVAQERLQLGGMIRDNLFQVGSTALELMLCRDMFMMNPSATPSDLHLLLACAQTHDVLAYILLKNGLHTCLFDEDLPRRGKILQAVEVADVIGLKLWDANEGWILPGGILTFQSRLAKVRSVRPCSMSPNPVGPVGPRYPGLAGGRLHGTDKKLSMNEIIDWQFSLKCIFGALVLSFGLESSWTEAFRPLFEEVLLLSADEYREHFTDASTICKSYSRGNTNCLVDG